MFLASEVDRNKIHEEFFKPLNVERYYRYAKIKTIYEAISEIQK